MKKPMKMGCNLMIIDLPHIDMQSLQTQFTGVFDNMKKQEIEKHF